MKNILAILLLAGICVAAPVPALMRPVKLSELTRPTEFAPQIVTANNAHCPSALACPFGVSVGPIWANWHVDGSGNLLVNAAGTPVPSGSLICPSAGACPMALTPSLAWSFINVDSLGNLLVNCSGCGGGGGPPLGTAAQIPVMNAGATAYAPVTMSGCTITSAGAVTCTPTAVGLSNVTNNAQTQASVMPNTAPASGQFPIGNVGGTAYIPQTMTQDCTITNAGVITCLKTNNVAFTALATTTPGANVATFLATPTAANLAAAATASNAAGTTQGLSTYTYNGTTSGTAVPGCVPVSNCASGFGGTGLNSVWNKVTSGTAGGSAGYDDSSTGFTTAAMSAQTTATCTNVTNMTWTIVANKSYRLMCQVPRTLAASATIQYCLGGPGTATSYSLDVQGANGSAGVWSDLNTLAQTAWGTKTTASQAAANTAVDNIYAFIQNGATGSGTALTLQTAANGTNSITVLANASCVLTQAN